MPPARSPASHPRRVTSRPNHALDLNIAGTIAEATDKEVRVRTKRTARYGHVFKTSQGSASQNIDPSTRVRSRVTHIPPFAPALRILSLPSSSVHVCVPHLFLYCLTECYTYACIYSCVLFMGRYVRAFIRVSANKFEVREDA